MLGFSSYDSLTHALIHRHLTRMLYAHVCVSFSWVWLFNGILFRNEIAAKCNSIEVCSRRRQIITEYEKNKWINFGFRCFEHTNTHTNTQAYKHSRTRNVVVIAVGFWTFTAKLENLLLIYLFFFIFWAQSSTLPQPPPQQSPSKL